MASSRSGNKGKEFEREISKFFNTLYDTKEFTRTPGSGNFMGLSNAAKKASLGSDAKNVLSSDLIVPTWFKFSVECKWYKDSPQYHNLLQGKDSDLDRWLGETLFDAKNLQQIPMLIFKTNRKGKYIAVPSWMDLSNIPVRLLYHEFWIIDLEQIVNISHMCSTMDQQMEENQVWLQTSKYVEDTIAAMLRKK
jgi:hypothetical protein